MSQLPKRTDSPLYLPVTEEQKSAHDDVARKVARLAAIAERRPLTQQEHLQLMCYLNTMRMISNGLVQFEYDDIWPSIEKEKNPEKRIPSLFSPKLGEFRNLIDGLLGQKVKVVIFSQWLRMLRLAHWSISDLLRDSSAEAVFFTGQETTRRRTENIVRFHDDPSVRLFFATDAGGVGLNLQQAASVCINLELPWNPAVLEQRNSRIYRLGQKQPVQIFNMITQGTIEERIQTLVARKQAVFSALFDGTCDEVRFENGSGFYKQIQNVMAEFNQDPAIDDDDDMASELPVTETETQAAPAPTEQPRALAAPIGVITADQLKHAFAGLKIERGESGRLKIEAEPESAALLASVFKGIAELFM